MIRATEIREDLPAMIDVLDSVSAHFDRHNQIGVTARPGAAEPLYDAVGWLPDDATEADYSEITEPFVGTAVERLLRRLPFGFGRTRLMRMRPKSCLSIHADPARRYHLALITNPGCYFVGLNGNDGRFHHIPADGCLYELDTHRSHTAMNTGKLDRIHLVICPSDTTRPDDAEPLGRRS